MARTIEECGPVLRKMRKEERERLIKYLRLQGLLRGRIVSLHRSCVAARLCQADLVLSCLRLGLVRCAEALVGRPIVHCPPSLALARVQRPAGRGRRRGDDRLVIGTREPMCVERGRRRLLSTELYDRIARAKVGMSVRMLISRGVTRRDIRIATKRGYIKVEGAS